MTPRSPLDTLSGHLLEQWRLQQLQSLDRLSDQEFAAQLRQELNWLLLETTDLQPLDLHLQHLPPFVHLHMPWARLEALWQQKLTARVPVQYLTGTAHWRQFQLQISSAVLIPRPETEELIDWAMTAAAAQPPALQAVADWADLGTGSGVIALGLASLFPEGMIHAVDVSEAALAIAALNAQTQGLKARIQFYQGEWLQPLAHLRGSLRGIVSNPPYIPTALIPTLTPEVSQHEPHLALDGGVDGLGPIREIIATAPQYLCSGGVLLFEMMMGQDQAIYQLLQAQGDYRQIQIHRDLAGVARFAQAERK
ncbi:MAG: peptide chain release factor N(5)-glutamine methyltransferase [Acaryochloridaceae cyanobacterium SU_2_1]|nr:peptide chain release factor N(5)-glutamine methyltransferase [Acaryochloridaceae cyanobacterium SU_2_1]NJM95473.1 peptide chain release factor N(5)-glutamine methyltransferase [Acaryochloridaceae cyanobacterium CSU_5_19]